MCAAKGVASIRASVLFLIAALGGCGLGSVARLGADGQLATCGSAPHCVSSLAGDEAHRVDPLRYEGSRAEAHQRLLRTLRALPRTEVVVDEPRYIRAEATSTTLRFVDDLEVLLPNEEASGGLIQVRSSSRLGYSDMGVNRQRVDALRSAFNGAGP